MHSLKTVSIEIDYPGSNNYSSFIYGPLGACAKIIEIRNATVTSTKQFVGEEERDSSGSVTRQFFKRGEAISGVSYYFAKDHLGSIREVTDSSGVIQAKYSFDPYGQITKLQGSVDADFQFAGMYLHAPSGLYLTPARQYSTRLGTWLSRDPADGASYSYVAGNPISRIDPTGLYYEVSQTTVNGIAFVDINVPITWIGGSNKESLIAQYTSEIYQAWNRRVGDAVLRINISSDNSGRNVIDLCTKNKSGRKTTGLTTNIEPAFGTLLKNQNMFGFWAPSLSGRVAHEFGHILGLSHDEPGGSLMSPSPFLGTNISAADVQSIVNGSPYNHGLGFFGN